MSAHRPASTVPGIRRPPRLSPGRCGLHGGPRRATRRLRRVVHRSSGGPRLIPPSAPLPKGATAARPAPACRWTAIPNAFQNRRQEMCVQMRHTILADRRPPDDPKHSTHHDLRSPGVSLFTRALQRVGRFAALCSTLHPGGVKFGPCDILITTLNTRLQSSGFHNSVAPSAPFKRPRKNSPTARSAYGVGNGEPARDRASHRHRSGLKIPARPLSAPVTPLASIGSPSSINCAAGGPEMPVPPISFPPFGNPPFLIPPPNSNPPKGGKPQGALARRPLWRGWGNRRAPLPPRSRAPPPFGFPVHSAACPPCAVAPEGPGALVGQGRARSSHLPNPSWSSQAHPLKRAAVALAPLAPFRPRGGGRVRFALLPASRGRAARKTRMGRSPYPLARRACCPAAGGQFLARVIINHILVVIGTQCAPSNEMPPPAAGG